MKTFFLITGLLAIAANALPTPPGVGLVTLPLEPVPQNDRVHPYERFARHLETARSRRFLAPPMPHLHTRATNGSTTLPLSPFANDIGYFATIQLGTPPQAFRMHMDSGSADMWVMSTTCASAKFNRTERSAILTGDCSPEAHPQIGSEKSSTFVDMGETFEVSYGDGARVEGRKVLDTFRFGLDAEVKNLQFAVSDRQTEDLSDPDTPFDGLMGLALPRLGDLNGLTPVDALAAAGVIREPVVSYKLGRKKDGGKSGEVTFGGMDATKFDAKTKVVLPNTSEDGFWVVTMDGVFVNGTAVPLPAVEDRKNKREALMDTGTTLLVIPRADSLLLHTALNATQTDGAGSPWAVPCDTKARVELVFGGRKFAIDSRDLVFAKVQGDKPEDEVCLSGVGELEGDRWLVGDTFLKNVYLSTNAKTNEVSIAELV